MSIYDIEVENYDGSTYLLKDIKESAHYRKYCNELYFE